ncbi:hypothetical protein PAEPH01_0064 [Pancytospora epiphaga]|nr:hypothetical protein PAEPH01_0064 [Pancytospora epiphaga]
MRKAHIKKTLERQVKKKLSYSMRPVRFALPFPICCVNCKHYMDKFTRHNAQMETVAGMTSCGAEVYRFAVKCKECGNACTLLSDPENGCYKAESSCFKVPEKIEEEEPGRDDLDCDVRRYAEITVLKRHMKYLENVDIPLAIKAVTAGKTIQQVRREELLETLRKVQPIQKKK